MTITGNIERFQYFNCEINFLKNANFLKNWSTFFLVESTKIDNITFTYKTALSEANAKTNRMGSTKLTYHKEVLPVITFLLRKFCSSLATSYIELIWCTNHSNIHIHTFRKCWSFTLGYFFPVSILKIDLNAAEIRNFQDYVCTRNEYEWKYTFMVLKVRVKQVT